MAGSILGLGVRLEARDGMSGPAKSAGSSLSQLQQQAMRTQKAMGQLQVRAGAVATGIGVALTGAVGAAVAEAAELEHIMKLVQQKTGFTDDKIQELSDDFLLLSATLPLSAQELAKVGVIAGQLGIGTTEGIKSLAFEASQLARAAEMTEEASAAALARLSKLFQLPIEESRRLGSSLVALANSTTANAAGIFETTKRFAGMATIMGVSAAQANAFSATMIDAGIASEEGGSAMQRILSRATEKSAGFAKQMGITEGAFKEMFNRDSTETLIQFIESFQGMDKFSVANALKDLGLQRVGTAKAITGLANLSEDLRKNVNTSVKAFEEGTEMFRAFEAVTKSFRAKVDTFVGSLKNVAISIGNTLLPVLGRMVDAGTEFLAMFLAMPTPIKAAVAVVTAFAGGLFLLGGAGLLITGTMSLLSVSMLEYASMAGIAVTSNSVLGITWTVMKAQLFTMIPGLRGATLRLKGWWLWTKASVAGNIAAAGGFWALTKSAWASSAAFVKGLFPSLGSAILMAKGWVITAWTAAAAGGGLSASFGVIAGAAATAGAAIWTALAPVLPIIAAVAAAALVLYVAWKAFAPLAKIAVKAVMAPINALWSVVKSLLNVVRVVGSFIAGFVGGVVTMVKPVFDTLFFALEAILAPLRAIGALFAGAGGDIDGAAESASNFGAALGKFIAFMSNVLFVVRFLAVGVRLVATVIGGLIMGVVELFGELLAPIKAIGASFMEILGPVFSEISGFFTSFSGGGDYLGGFFRVIGTGAKFAIKWLHPIGWIMTGVKLALQVLGGVAAEVFRSFGGVWASLKEAASSLLGTFSEVWGQLKDAFASIGEPLEELFAAIGSIFSGGSEDAITFADVLHGIGRVIGWIIATPLKLLAGGIRLLAPFIGFLVRVVAAPIRAIALLVGGLIRLVKWAGGAIVGVFQWIGEALGGTLGGMMAAGGGALSVFQAIGHAIAWIFSGAGAGNSVVNALADAAQWLKDTWDTLVGSVKNTILRVAQPLYAFFKALGAALGTVFAVVAQPIARVFQGIAAAVRWIGELFTAIFTGAGSQAGDNLGMVSGSMSTIMRIALALSPIFRGIAWVVGKIVAVVKALRAGLQWVIDAFGRMVDVVKAPVDAIVGVVGGLADGVSSFAGGVVDAVGGVGDAMLDAGAGLVSTVGGFMGDAGAATAGFFGDIAAGIGGGLSTLGGLIGLAEGGIVQRPTLAVIGERGPEAVVPLPRPSPTAASTPAAAGFSRSGRGGGRATVQATTVVIPITLECDGEVLARVTRTFQLDELLRAGESPPLDFTGAR